jgi:hypothetical protein
MVATFLASLLVVEVIAYLVLLGRLANVTRERLPSLFATVGGPGVNDYWICGAPFLSRLESHREEIAKAPQILSLMGATRSLYIALIATVCLGIVAMAAYAN